MPEFANKDIEATFAAFPDRQRKALFLLRTMIFEIAAERDDVGTIIEELKWGQPSYATKPKTGCPIRLGVPKGSDAVALYVPCQTSLIGDLRQHYGDSLDFEGNRAIHINLTSSLPEAELRHAITLGLTYYVR